MAGILHLLTEASKSPVVPALEDICNCIVPGTLIFGVELDLKSLAIGVAIGYLLGPVLEALVLLRQLWSLQLRCKARGCAPKHYTGSAS